MRETEDGDDCRLARLYIVEGLMFNPNLWYPAVLGEAFIPEEVPECLLPCSGANKVKLARLA